MPTKITSKSKGPITEGTDSPRTDKPTATSANNIAAICNILLTSLRKMTEPRCMLFATQFTPWCKGYHQLETARSDVCHTAKHPAITASISSAQGPDAIATGPTTQPEHDLRFPRRKCRGLIEATPRLRFGIRMSALRSAVIAGDGFAIDDARPESAGGPTSRRSAVN